MTSISARTRTQSAVISYGVQLDNYSPARNYGAGLAAVYAATDDGTGRPETITLDPSGMPLGTDDVYLMDDGATVRPFYVAGWRKDAPELYLQPFPVDGGTRADNGRPVDMSGWQLGPRKAWHLKVRRTVALAPIVGAYIACALWSSTGEDSEPLDAVHSADDLAPDALASMAADVADFVGAVLSSRNPADLDDIDPEQIGHDFWLTRNGHGAGFWDRGNGAQGDRLAELARIHGSSDVYVGDDGALYVN